jgi:hypothetical protein
MRALPARARDWIATALLLLLVGSCSPGNATSEPTSTSGLPPSSTTHTTSSTTPASTTSLSTTSSTSATTTTLPPEATIVDLAALFERTPAAIPTEVIRLPWGHAPGEVWHSAGFGPCCFDLLPDGSIVLVDSYNLRIQHYDGSSWRVLYVFDRELPPLPDGIAALDSGLVAVATVPRGDSLADRTVLLIDLDGRIVDQGLAETQLNNPWWGGEDLWVALGRPPFSRWVRVTLNGALIPFENQEVVSTFADSGRTFQMSYDRRGDVDARYNIVTVTIEADGDLQRWALHGGEVAGGAQFELSEDAVTGLWWADGSFLLVRLQPGGSLDTIRIPRNQWDETGTFNFFRVRGDRLYVLQTYPDGASIEVYELP